MVCDQDVCERWFVTKMCVKDGVWQRCLSKEDEEAEEEEADEDGPGGIDPKTRTPHNDAGNQNFITMKTHPFK